MAQAFFVTAPNTTKLFSSSKPFKKIIPPCLPLFRIAMQFDQHHHFQANWSSLSSEISHHILKHLPTAPPPIISEPMRRLISAAPSSVASALCLAACELVGGQKDQAMNAACAIQLMHAGARTHSQLLRLEHVVKPGIQLMAGDGILPLGYQMAASLNIDGNNDGDDHERILRVIVEIAGAVGARGVVEGQLLEAEGRGWPEWVWERKGGKMSACGAACGAIMGGGKEEDVEKLRRFGWYVGMMDEMMMMAATSVDHKKYMEVSESFRSLAMLELQGFEESRAKSVMGLFLGQAYEGIVQ